jgi:hypothetical protein
VLKADIRVDGDPVDSEVSFNANFQLVEYATNAVAHNSWSHGLTLQYGTEFSISQGDLGSQEPDSTPAKWGLKRGLYSFRALIEIPASGVFCVSDRPVVFRVR